MKTLEKNSKIRLMFIDIVLAGGMRGDELAAEVRALRAELCIIYTSGYADSALPDGVLGGQDAPLLRKPFRRADLAGMVRRAFDEAKVTS